MPPRHDYYDVLGVERDADASQIKRAYRKLARELHPDLNPDPVTQERFKDVTVAYEVLSDPEKRRMFDSGVDPLASGPGGGGGAFDFGDLMDAFFGQSGPRGPRPRQQRGQDALLRISVDLDEVMFSSEREVTIDTAVACGQCEGAGTAPNTEVTTCAMCKGHGEIQSVQRSFLGQVMTTRVCPQCQGFGTVVPHPCPECSGAGRVRTRRSVVFKIPAGIQDGTRIQLAGQGEVGPGAGPAGDLLIEIVEKPHEVFLRQGDDLHCTLSVPMTAAALGAEIPLETLEGPEIIQVEAGTQSGAEHRLRDRGVPRLRGGGRGSLTVHLQIETPGELDSAQRALLEDLARMRGEEKPRATPIVHNAGLFSRIKDAFAGK